jgi:RNA polymerase sigma-70 factor (ECF subfamily)
MNADTFDALVTDAQGEIYRFLRRAILRRADADDLIQETFLRAYRAHRTLPPDANARAWLFTIAANVVKNHLRSECRRQQAHSSLREVTRDRAPSGPEWEALANETRAALEAAVAALPVKQRLAFTLRKVHDLDYDAIAKSLDCSADSARANVFQALKKLRRHLNGYDLPARTEER